MPNLKNNQIKRLSFKAGVLRLSELNYDELRAIIGIKLEPIIKKSYIVANNQHRKIIQLDDVLKVLPTKMLGLRKSSKKCKIRSTKYKRSRRVKAIDDIKFYQKQPPCLIFAKESFKRLVKDISKDISKEIRRDKSPLKFSQDSINLLQYYIENIIINLLSDSNLIAIHAKRETVMPKDILLVRHMQRQRLDEEY